MSSIFSSGQRWAIFSVGAVVGCTLAALIFRERGLPHPPVSPDPGVIRRQVPGALVQWMMTRKPIEGDFVLSQAPQPSGKDGGRVRAVVVSGLDDGAFIRIEEQYVPATPAAEPVVREWKFMFADRVRAQLQPPADTRVLADALHEHGWRLLARDKGTNWVTIALAAHHANSVPEALAQLSAWPQLVARAEPDLLPAPGMTSLGRQ